MSIHFPSEVVSFYFFSPVVQVEGIHVHMNTTYLGYLFIYLQYVDNGGHSSHFLKCNFIAVLFDLLISYFYFSLCHFNKQER